MSTMFEHNAKSPNLLAELTRWAYSSNTTDRSHQKTFSAFVDVLNTWTKRVRRNEVACSSTFSLGKAARHLRRTGRCASDSFAVGLRRYLSRLLNIYALEFSENKPFELTHKLPAG